MRRKTTVPEKKSRHTGEKKRLPPALMLKKPVPESGKHKPEPKH